MANRREIATDVLNLGQTLFDIVLDAVTEGQCANEQPQQAEHLPMEDMRAASDEFFTALRLLLDLEGTT